MTMNLNNDEIKKAVLYLLQVEYCPESYFFRKQTLQNIYLPDETNTLDQILHLQQLQDQLHDTIQQFFENKPLQDHILFLRRFKNEQPPATIAKEHHLKSSVVKQSTDDSLAEIISLLQTNHHWDKTSTFAGYNN